MASMAGDEDDSDVPEELTAQQGIEQDKELRKVEKESQTRIAQKGKERRRQWAQRKTRQSSNTEILETTGAEPYQDEQDTKGMLPSNVVNLLAAREKQVFSSDSEGEIIDREPISRKKKQKLTGPIPVLLKDLPLAQCSQNSLEFLKRRKMQVPRSHSVLKNANQALRLISSRGGFLRS